MNNILKIFISLLFFLLLITTAGQEEYASVKSSFFQKSNVTSSYQQTQSPCKRPWISCLSTVLPICHK